MRESTIEKYLVDQCKKHGIYCRKWVSVNNRGVPDRILLVGGLWWAVEVKAPGKKPTRLQLLEHKTIRKNGGNISVIDSKEQVDRFVSYLLYATSVSDPSD